MLGQLPFLLMLSRSSDHLESVYLDTLIPETFREPVATAPTIPHTVAHADNLLGIDLSADSMALPGFGYANADGHADANRYDHQSQDKDPVCAHLDGAHGRVFVVHH